MFDETNSYNFTVTEIKSLILLLRKHEHELTADLDSLNCWLEQKIYENMTIDEAEIFFNENQK